MQKSGWMMISPSHPIPINPPSFGTPVQSRAVVSCLTPELQKMRKRPYYCTGYQTPHFIFAMLKALVVLGSMLATAAAQEAAAGAAGAAAPAAGAAGAKLPKEEFARQPWAASEHSIAVERERGDTNVPVPPAPCAKEISKPCQQNVDCACTGFCYFKKGSDVLSGTCEKYNRVIHAA
jgi:hypothetical protein